MKNRLKIISNYLFLSASMFIFFSCSSDKSVEPPPQTDIKIIVKSVVDSSAIAGSNVVLYNANSGESLMRVTSGADGSAEFIGVNQGSFYVRIAAQGYKDLPIGNISPVPFSVNTWETFTQTYYMDTLQGVYGKIDGNLVPAQGGFLIVAASSGSGTEVHTYSGPDGYFALFNVPFGVYQVYAVRSGYTIQDKPDVTLTPASPDASVSLSLVQSAGSSLNGMVTFLAAENGLVDISLLDRSSHSVVTGLTTRTDSSRDYILENIPAGEYIAWASYENDGYVMDPDWIFKNPGALNISFSSDSSAVLNFSVTDAISIISPTNPDESIIPVVADSVVPTFSWDQYPQAKEYIIEVRDINGDLVWGGFDENGVIRHAQIPRSVTNIQFNFDGSAFSQLQEGQVYQWKIYADDDLAPNVQTLLSSSEDLKGLFIIP